MQVLVDDLEISYSRSGKGRVLLLLHGWGASKENLKQLADVLSHNFEVISLDFPGFGASQIPQAAWDVGAYAQFVRRFLQVIAVQQVYGVIGHSFGGRVIIKAVSGGMLKPEKVILLGAAGVKPKITMRSHVYKLVAKSGKMTLSLPVLRKYSARARSKLYRSAGTSDYLATNGTMRRVFLKTIDEDLSHLAKDVTCPVLLVWGSEDRDAPLADARFYAAAMPSASLKIVQEAGHFVHNDNPRKVVRWVESFLG